MRYAKWQHYPHGHITHLSPTWTIRFEAEHEYYKQIIHRTRNTKYITKTFQKHNKKSKLYFILNRIYII